MSGTTWRCYIQLITSNTSDNAVINDTASLICQQRVASFRVFHAQHISRSDLCGDGGRAVVHMAAQGLILRPK